MYVGMEIIIFAIGLYFIYRAIKQLIWNTSMLREDVRGTCHKPCLYNDNGKCDMWDEISVPDETEKCDNQIDV